MSDKIKDFNEEPKVDRQDLNINTSNSKKPNAMIIGVFLLLGLGIFAFAVFWSFKTGGSVADEVIVAEEDVNYDLGKEKSSVEDSNNFFQKIGKEFEMKRLKQEKEKEKEEIKEKSVDASLVNGGTESKVPPLVTKIGEPTPLPREERKPKPKVEKNSSSRSGSSRSQVPSPSSRKLSGSVTFDVGGGSSLAGGVAGNEFDNSFNASRFENGSAVLRDSGSLDFLLVHGMNIPCSLYTQIISDYNGFVTCRVINDVYSANGSVLLIEAGSLASGTQSVSLELGKARTFTTWSDIQTPNGVSIFVDSLGSGPLGAAGHNVWVDNHFKERFGGAILLSFVDDGLSALAESAGNRNVQFDNSTQNVGDMAATALESSINIAPTGYSYLGQKINILLTRDIDLSSIYSVGDTK